MHTDNKTQRRRFLWGRRRSTHTHTQNKKVRKLVQNFFTRSRRRRRRRRRIKLLSPR
jgi:hypothetical protein